MTNSRSFQRRLFLAVVLLPVPIVHRASAIDIVPVFNAAASEFPEFDATASGLQSLFSHAESFFEDVFEDNHTITINFWYQDLNATTGSNHTDGTIAYHDLLSQGPSCNNLTGPSANCRELEANIRIDTRVGNGGSYREWFIDPTPAVNEEFNMQQTLWRDLSGIQQSTFYDAQSAIPPTFETGFGGTAIDPGSDAGQHRDLLSTILHEVGHGLGMLPSNNSTWAETNNDQDYDFPSDFVSGATLAARNIAGQQFFHGHLANSKALMYAFAAGNGTRILPSHTDFFSMATGHSYVDLDVPRREFYRGNDWHVAGNWSGNAVPGGADMAFVRHGGFVALSANAAVDSLVVDEQTQLATSSHRLTVFESLAVQNTSFSGTTLLSVSTSGELVVNELSIGESSRTFVGGHLDANNIDVVTGGEITGTGTIDISDASGTLTNDGRIAALFDGVLTIDSDNPIGLDLDGGGLGMVEAIDGDLVLNAGLPDDFNGTATVSAGRTMTFNGGLSVGAGGLLFLDGVTLNGATVNGTIVGVAQNGVVRGNGRSIVAAALTLNDGAVVETSDAATELRMNGTTTFAGGSVSGTGTVLQTGNANVIDDTTIHVATYDMDGLNGNSTIDVSAERTLRVESTSIESTGGGDGYDGTLNINNGTVDIVAPWVLQGTVNLNDSGTGSPELTGAGGVTVDGGQINFSGGSGQIDTPVAVNNGTIFVDADGTMNGPTILGVGTTVDINGGNDSLRLRGQTILVGPSIVGNGRLILEDNVNVAFTDTSIGVAETDLDGQSGDTEITINNGLTLSISSSTIEPTANDGFDGRIHNQGTFSVLAGWRLDGVLNMDPLSTGTSTLDGAGLFEISESGIVDAREDVVINPDTTAAGTINVSAGRTQFNGSSMFLPTAGVNITSTGELELNGAAEFNGGSYQGQGTFQWDGPVTVVVASTAMTLGVVDFDGTGGNTATTLNNQLTLNVDQVDITTNRYDGTLNINGLLAGLRVNLNDPNARWQMDGTLNASGGGVGGLPQNILQGSDVDVTGTINADSVTQTMAVIDLGGRITTLDADTEFRFSFGPHVIRNTAVVDGLGTMVVNSNGTVLAEDGSTIAIDVINRGRLEPGTSIGSATIMANYTQDFSGTFAVELAGDMVNKYDLLAVDRTATLAGELEVAAIDGFVPTVGSTYTVLTANRVTGTFDTLTTLSDSIFNFDLSVSYPGTRVVLQVTDVSMTGDFNDDMALGCADVDALVAEIASGGMNLDFDLTGEGIIDLNDLDQWLAVAGTFNVGGPYLPGDANLDGTVDGLDFIEWNSNKFTSTAAWCLADFNADGTTDGRDFIVWNNHKFMSSDTGVAVPEPMSSAYLLIGVSLLCCRGRRRW